MENDTFSSTQKPDKSFTNCLARSLLRTFTSLRQYCVFNYNHDRIGVMVSVRR